jgi:hypothetical protein
MKLSTAQQVRLWIAGVCQLIGIIIMVTIPTPDGNHVFYMTTQNGYPYEGWSFVFLFTAGILAGISLYRFLRPIKKDDKVQ